MCSKHIFLNAYLIPTLKTLIQKLLVWCFIEFDVTWLCLSIFENFCGIFSQLSPNADSSVHIKSCLEVCCRLSIKNKTLELKFCYNNIFGGGDDVFALISVLEKLHKIEIHLFRELIFESISLTKKKKLFIVCFL